MSALLVSDCGEDLLPGELGVAERSLAVGGLRVEHATIVVHMAELRTADGLKEGRAYKHDGREVRFSGTRERPPSRLDELWARRTGRAAVPVVESVYCVSDGPASSEGLDAQSAARLFVRLALEKRARP